MIRLTFSASRPHISRTMMQDELGLTLSGSCFLQQLFKTNQNSEDGSTKSGIW